MKEIYIILMGILKIYAIYFAVVTVVGLIKNRKQEQTDQKTKFAVLVPARNEEKCITGIINTLKQQKYPEELIDIFVIPNNCTDRTKEKSQDAGAYIIDVPEHVDNKGKALSYGIDELLKTNRYGAFLVFDADNRVNEEFISQMNKAFCAGANVAKSRIYAQEPYQNIVATFYDMHFCIANRTINKPRENLGLSARVIGTGFGISSKFLKQIGGFTAHSITEDAEFYVQYSTIGERCVYCENAITYDEQPQSFRISLMQRKRWMSGIMQVFVMKIKDILKSITKRKSFKYGIDAFMQLSFTYVQALLPFVILIGALAYKREYIQMFLEMISSGYITVFAIGIGVILIEKRFFFNKNTILGIILYPIFVLSFIPLQTVSLFKKTKKWRQMEHKGIETKV